MNVFGSINEIDGETHEVLLAAVVRTQSKSKKSDQSKANFNGATYTFGIDTEQRTKKKTNRGVSGVFYIENVYD